jgi:hypothetical protein
VAEWRIMMVSKREYNQVEERKGGVGKGGQRRKEK